ncbi:hypothetical protein D8I24_2073 [Cupriavidus necator H850]|nr:hypothetical protein D8I24_2073 [Cupriavidus necator H850]
MPKTVRTAEQIRSSRPSMRAKFKRTCEGIDGDLPGCYAPQNAPTRSRRAANCSAALAASCSWRVRRPYTEGH